MLRLLFVVVAGIAFGLTWSLAAEIGRLERRVQTVVLLDAMEDPIVGVARCRIDQWCKPIFDVGSSVEISVRLHWQDTRESGDLKIDCGDGCSFRSGRSRTSFQDQRMFDIFRGEEIGPETLLVLKPATRIGEVFLIIE
ncbi:hypothetical protein [Rhizobium glycinendophyticum]|uniref:Uncharacterized protein n=1 Tax=Rhizobium glycinendophyticum TaxID=2589807 RepID=A0A504UQT5_9HYPH|nr:hypothetical protein [Rhizobium glycinendophyticum]TPP11176.1 hypothetical protein FJQ55_10255 [Rhizobium glycinendophyticum]